METTKVIPIKRNEALIKFSKEHHYGLLLGWEVKQGIKKDKEPKRIADYVLFFFDNNLKQHFLEEENTLFSKLGDDNIFKQRALREHSNINGLIRRIRNGNYNMEILMAFVNDLEEHIRFEERILFNHIQQKLSEEELQDVLSSHKNVVVDVEGEWHDRFWEE